MPLQFIERVPSGSTGPLPLVICMHGRGADANDLADLAPMLDGSDGYRFLFPNAPKPFEPYRGMQWGWTWFDDLPPEPKSFAESRALLLDFIDQAVARFEVPDGKLIISGFSQGGVMSIDCGFRTKQRVAGIVVLSGAAYDDDLPQIHPIPTFIAHGLDDEVLPIVEARRARRILEEHGVEPEYHELPIGHQVSAEEIELVRQFIERCLA